MKPLLTKLKVLIVGPLITVILLLIYRSMRWTELRFAPLDLTVFDQPVKILAFWHGKQLMVAPHYFFATRQGRIPFHVLISEHSDGRVIAHAISLIGLQSIPGSSTRGGRTSMKKMLAELKKGHIIGITPDGPKGPIHQSKIGVLRLSQATGVPICPLSYSASRFWKFGSWDGMILPKPFSKGVFVVGEPLTVPRDLNEAQLVEYGRELDQRLNTIGEKADEFLHA